MPSLVCIAHGKSGTTFLDQFFRNKTNVAVPLLDKEIKYFNEETVSLEGYAKHFGLNSADFLKNDFVSFEASPPYVTNQKRPQIEKALRRLKATLPDPRILIAVRDPLQRAFSHYAHTLYEISQRGFPPLFRDMPINYAGYPQPDSVVQRILNNPSAVSIEDALSDPEICGSSYADCYELAIDIFGVENVMVFWMEEDLADFPSFVKRLQKYFDINFEYDCSSLSVALKGRGAPYYVYGGKEGRDVEIEGISFFLHPKQLLIVRSDPSFLIDNVDEKTYQSLVAAHKHWTIDISTDHASDIYEKFLRKDYEKFLSLYQKNHGNLFNKQPRQLTIKGKKIAPARFEGMVPARLKQEGHILPGSSSNLND